RSLFGLGFLRFLVPGRIVRLCWLLGFFWSRRRIGLVRIIGFGSGGFLWGTGFEPFGLVHLVRRVHIAGIFRCRILVRFVDCGALVAFQLVGFTLGAYRLI